MTNRLDLLFSAKSAGQKLAMLTAYDYPTGRLLDEAGVDAILVGDSLGMVVLGYPDTTLVTMDDMLHHTRAVVRGVQRAPVIADLPFAAYETPQQAGVNAGLLMQAGAQAVKLEGGVAVASQIAAIVAERIPVVGHIGMLPQHVREEGGYKIKGKTPEAVVQLEEDARAVEKAGALAVVLELVKADVARQLSAMLRIPTIGIGSGPDCDGQILVTHDLIGMFPWFPPKFAKPLATTGAAIRAAAQEYVAGVRGR